MVRIILINHERGASQALVQRAVADIPKIDQVRSGPRTGSSASRARRMPRVARRVSVARLRVPVCRRCARICTRCTGRSEQALPTTTLLPISSTSAPGLVTSAPGLADYKRSALCSTAFASRRFSLLFSEHGREGTRCQGRPRVACRAALGTMPRGIPCSVDTSRMCRSGQQSTVGAAHDGQTASRGGMHTWFAWHRASPAADGAQSPEGQRYSDES